MSIIVTGGAGFIGSCIVRALNDDSVDDIIVVDNIASTEKWKNLCNKRFLEYIHKDALFTKLESYQDITHIIHMGACSDTTVRDFDYLYRNNVAYSQALYEYCVKKQIPFIYASSAATYGDGSQGFDDESDIETLRPLNGYGYSKQMFDIWVKRQAQRPPQCVGLKFFNVYGPNEYCKGAMASMFYHGFRQIQETGKVRLFKSYHKGYEDGGQLRDFVYVKDVCAVVKYFLKNPGISGLFNVGTGRAQSFAKLAESLFAALNMPANIEYVDMPEQLKEKYQYYTEAKTDKLRLAGYSEPYIDIADGARDYVWCHLAKDYKIY